MRDLNVTASEVQVGDHLLSVMSRRFESVTKVRPVARGVWITTCASTLYYPANFALQIKRPEDGDLSPGARLAQLELVLAAVDRLDAAEVRQVQTRLHIRDQLLGVAWSTPLDEDGRATAKENS